VKWDGFGDAKNTRGRKIQRCVDILGTIGLCTDLGFEGLPIRIFHEPVSYWNKGNRGGKRGPSTWIIDKRRSDGTAAPRSGTARSSAEEHVRRSNVDSKNTRLNQRFADNDTDGILSSVMAA